MAKAAEIKQSYLSNPPSIENLRAGNGLQEVRQDEGAPEALTDALIRFSLLTWRSEMDTRTPHWSQVQDQIFSELVEFSQVRDCT